METNMNNTSTIDLEESMVDCSDKDDGRVVVYEYYFQRQINSALFITTSILGLIGNSLVILAVVLSKRLRTTTNVFVVNLAIADLLTCLFLPWQAVAILGGEEWPIPSARWLCVTASFVIITTLGCSLNSLALIAVNRWVGITKSPAVTRRLYTPCKLTLMVIFSWAMPFSCALVPVVTVFGDLGYNEVYSSCTWDNNNPHTYFYTLAIAGTNYPIQLILIVVSYTKIYLYVRKTSRTLSRSYAPSISGEIYGQQRSRTIKRILWTRQVAVTKNLLYIVTAFIVCLSPYIIAISIKTEFGHKLAPWGGAVLFCNSCVNPVIYACSHPDFKTAFRHIIRCQLKEVSLVKKKLQCAF